MPPVLSLVIPCYNEAEQVPALPGLLAPVLARLAAHPALRSQASGPDADGSCREAQDPPLEILFVDDGSGDGTAALLEAAFAHDSRVRVLRHPENRGLGAALRTGLAAAGGEVVLTTDCDGTYRFHELPELLTRLAPEVDVVTASPYHPRGGVAGVPAVRLLFSRGASLLYRLLVSRDVHTYTSLCRVYRRAALVPGLPRDDGYLGVAELLVEALLAGHRVAEYPCVLHRRQLGVSKAKLARTTAAHLRFLASLAGRRLRSTASGRRRRAGGLPPSPGQQPESAATLSAARVPRSSAASMRQEQP